MDSRPLVTMKKLGNWGRFANQIFQYAFLRIYTQKNNFQYQVPEWCGRYLFSNHDPIITPNSFPTINDGLGGSAYEGGKSYISGSNPPFCNVDIIGYFQFHTSFYAPYKDFFRLLFKPKPDVERIVKRSVDMLRSRGNTIVALHLRRGDYGTFTKPGSRCFFVAPCEWYLSWLSEHWGKIDKPVLFIASDELHKVKKDFAKYNPLTNEDMGIQFPQVPMYPDFYTLSQCDILCTSNSSFSFAASMLNERCKEFYRPRWSLKKLIPYDPWNSHTLFRDEEY